jgi:cytochrome c oxidase assembly factor CtaG
VTAQTLVHWSLGVDWIVVSAVLCLAYAVGLWRLRRADEPWPPHRTVAFYAGIAAYLLVILGPIDSHDPVSFLAHTTEHLSFVFLVAPLVAVGAPIRLLQKASPAWFRSRVVDPTLSSGFVRACTNPVVVWVAFVGLLLTTHLIPSVYDAMTSNGNLHLAIHTGYLVTAFLFWSVVVGTQPFGGRLHRSLRIGYLLAVVPAVVVLGLSLLLDSDPLYPLYGRLPRPWGAGAALASQHQGGLLVLVVGVVAVTAGAAWANRRRDREPRAGRDQFWLYPIDRPRH